LSYRLWAAEHGGVYVFITPQTPPDPRLSFLKERDIKTPSGRTLTLVNPAYMTRQVQELAGRLYGARAHLTSLEPIDPENSPNPWEKKALEAFAAGTKKEIQEVVTVAGQPHLRLMRPWRTEKACLKCHASQGYKAGDIRGGLSVDVPLQPYLASVRAQTLPLAVGHGLIWVLGLAGILLRERYIRRELHQRRRSADILRESEARLAEAQRFAHLGHWEWDIARNKLMSSDEVYRIFGLEPQEFQPTHEDFLSFIHPDDLTAVKRQVAEGIRSGKFGLFDYRIIRRDGSIRSIYARGETYSHQDDQSLWMRGILQDITELKQAEEAVRESEERFRQAFENTNIGMALVGLDGRYLRVNRALSEMFGYSRAELEKMAVSDLTYPDDLQVSKDFRRQSLNGKIGSAQFDIRKMHRDSSIVWVHLASSLMRNSQGQPLYFVSQVQDITERKRAEETLTRQHALLAGINRIFKEALTCETEEKLGGTCLAVAEELTGSTLGYLFEVNQAGRFDTIAIGETGWEACKIPLAETKKLIYNRPVRGIRRTVYQTGEPLLANDPPSHPDFISPPEGHPPITAFLGVPLKNNGQTIGLIALGNKPGGYELADQEAVEALSVAIMEALQRCRAEDRVKKQAAELSRAVLHLQAEITERRQAEEALRRQAELLDLAHDAIIVRDMDSKVTFWSRGAEATYGFKKDSALAWVTHQLLRTKFPISREAVDEALREKGEWDGELIHTRRDGKKIVVASRQALQRNEAGQPSAILEINRDITAHKQAEEAVQRARQEMRDRIEERNVQLEQALALLQQEVEDRLEAEKSLCQARDELEQRVIERTAQLQQQADLLEDLYNNAPCGYHSLGPDATFIQINNTELNWLGYTREEVVGRLKFPDLLAPAHRPSFWENFASFLERGWVRDLEYELIRKDGTVLPVSLNATAIKDAAGNVLMSRSTSFDIGKRKRAEAALRESEQRLRHLASQILTAQEKERKRIAMELHEGLGQSMSVLKMYLRTIQQHLPTDAGRVEQEFEEAQNLLIEMIQEARRLSQGLSPVLLETLGLTAALKHLLDELSKYQEVTLTADIDDLRNLFSPQTQINLFRVFQESVHNIAKHAQATQVSVTIKRQNGSVNFLIKDNGVGFDPHQIPAKKITGRGMGLAAMRERLQMIGARLNIVSQIGTGSEISFSIQCDAQ
jgi:PAS domain S-box-containing protein